MVGSCVGVGARVYDCGWCLGACGAVRSVAASDTAAQWPARDQPRQTTAPI